MLFHTHNAPVSKSIHIALSTFYYSTGFSCAFIPYASVHEDRPEADLLKIISYPGSFLTVDTYSDDLDSLILNYLKSRKYNVTLQYHTPEHNYQFYVLWHLNKIHGIFISCIDESAPVQWSSLAMNFAVCIEQTKNIKSEYIIQPQIHELSGTSQFLKMKSETEQMLSENKVVHHPYHLEKKAMSQWLLNGASDQLSPQQFELDGYIIPPLGNDQVRSERNHLIVLIALFARTSISLGLDVDTAFSISDFLIPRIEDLTTNEEMLSFRNNAVLLYHEKIKESTSVLSPIVIELMHYVQQHLHEKISLKAFSQTTNYAYTYISNLFKEETGQTFSEFVTAKKIDAACYQLDNSDTSIQDISNQLGYSYPYLFTESFKKHTGMTPSRYRRLHRSNS